MTQNLHDGDILTLISDRIKSHNFHHFGFSKLTSPSTLPQYRKWLDQGFHGEMAYMEDHYALKAHPEATFPQMKSMILITKPYDPTIKNPLKIAAYAKERDYHFSFKADLQKIATELEQMFAGEKFLCFTDSVPLLEREAAHTAGLGWIGKNTCLIDRKEGSLFFIGEILTTLSLKSPASPSPDFCGNCTRCLDLCPTQALKPNRVLDSNLCIAYLTIEAKATPKPELRPLIRDWFFGCDICQTVCPWNEKKHGKDLMQELSQTKLEVSPQAIETLRQILKLSNAQLMELFAESPLSRARGFGLKRNALLVIGNLKISALKEDVKEASRQWPRLKELGDWTLSQISLHC